MTPPALTALNPNFVCSYLRGRLGAYRVEHVGPDPTTGTPLFKVTIRTTTGNLGTPGTQSGIADLPTIITHYHLDEGKLLEACV